MGQHPVARKRIPSSSRVIPIVLKDEGQLSLATATVAERAEPPRKHQKFKHEERGKSSSNPPWSERSSHAELWKLCSPAILPCLSGAWAHPNPFVALDHPREHKRFGTVLRLLAMITGMVVDCTRLH